MFFYTINTIYCVYQISHHAKEEGVKFHVLQNPKRILGDEDSNVRAIECLKYELGEPDDSGRRRPVPIEGSEFEIEVDTVIIAIGNGANPLIGQTTPGLDDQQPEPPESMQVLVYLAEVVPQLGCQHHLPTFLVLLLPDPAVSASKENPAHS